jgi:TRAP transporter TAXI family solute receptor
MTRRRSLLRAAPLALALAMPAAAPALAQSAAQTSVITVGTGSFSGTYYPVGRALCRVIDRETQAQRLRCSAEPTPGSVYNLRMLQSGELDFALAQADVQFAAINGVGAWAAAPVRGLRSLFALYDEVFTLVAAPGTPIAELADLRGRRINTGSAGSGSRATWDALAEALAWQGADRARAFDIRDVATALCNRSIDASAAVGFQPAASIRAQLAGCDARLIPVRGPAVTALLARYAYYRPVTLAAATYGTANDVETFGVSSDFVTTDRADPRVVAAIVRAVLANLDDLAMQSPALARLHRRALIGDGLTAPLHPAAAAVYREVGLLR